MYVMNGGCLHFAIKKFSNTCTTIKYNPVANRDFELGWGVLLALPAFLPSVIFLF